MGKKGVKDGILSLVRRVKTGGYQVGVSGGQRLPNGGDRRCWQGTGGNRFVIDVRSISSSKEQLFCMFPYASRYRLLRGTLLSSERKKGTRRQREFSTNNKDQYLIQHSSIQ